MQYALALPNKPAVPFEDIEVGKVYQVNFEDQRYARVVGKEDKIVRIKLRNSGPNGFRLWKGHIENGQTPFFETSREEVEREFANDPVRMQNYLDQFNY